MGAALARLDVKPLIPLLAGHTQRPAIIISPRNHNVLALRCNSQAPATPCCRLQPHWISTVRSSPA